MRLTEQKFACRFSSYFKNSKTCYYVEQLGYLININESADSLKFAKNVNFSLKGRFTRLGIDPFEVLNISPLRCGFCGEINNTWAFEYRIKDRVITITGITYKKPKHFCYSLKNSKKECPGKKLNPNSIDFVSVTNNISRAEAVKLIHERNVSPFYSENHKSSEEYSKYQADRLYGKPVEEVRAAILKIAETRYLNEKRLNGKRSGFSCITMEDGHMLRSNGERFFYSYAKEIGINDKIKSNGFYPGTFYCYDFCIPELNVYVEIAGMRGKSYEERLKFKMETFGAVIIHQSRSFKKECSDFLDNIKELLNESKP
jgi:hypothetical protein